MASHRKTRHHFLSGTKLNLISHHSALPRNVADMERKSRRLTHPVMAHECVTLLKRLTDGHFRQFRRENMRGRIPERAIVRVKVRSRQDVSGFVPFGQLLYARLKISSDAAH